MRQGGLFPSIQLEKDWLEERVSPLYPRLWRMIHEPFDDLLVRRGKDRAFRILTEGETAQWLRPQIVDLARTIFEKDAEIKVEKRRYQMYLDCGGEFAITPKKFKPTEDGDGITFSSYNTIQNKDYWGRREVKGLPMLPRLIVGYQFVGEMTDIKIWVAYPYGKTVSTYILMPDQSGAIIGLHQPTIDTEDAEDLIDDQGFKVKPRKKRKSDQGPG